MSDDWGSDGDDIDDGFGGAGGWDEGSEKEDLVDNWEDAPDFEEIERKKKEEEERKKKEEEDRAAAEKARKLEKKMKAEEVKKLKAQLDEVDDEDLAGTCFDIETIHENQEQNDFKNAIDALGMADVNIDDPSTIDIGVYQPGTVAEFDAYRRAVMNRINTIYEKYPRTDKVKFIQFIIKALVDDYKGSQIHSLDTYVTDMINNIIMERKKKHGYKVKKPTTSTSNKTFMNTEKAVDNDVDAVDDFM